MFSKYHMNNAIYAAPEDDRMDEIDATLHRIEAQLESIDVRLAGLEALGQHVREIHDCITREL